MWGSKTFKPTSGDWDHVGTAALLITPWPTGVTLPRGTFVNYLSDGAGSDVESSWALASSDAVGCITQEMDNFGIDTDANFKRQSIGITDFPLKNGMEVSARRFALGAEAEFEGLGAAIPGNLVATSGTGAIAANQAINTELSVFNGALRVAQSGDIVLALMKAADLPGVADAANRRIRVQFVGRYKKA